MTEQQQREACAELARAMYPTAVIEQSSSGDGVDIRIYDKPNETRSWHGFNPFTDPAASRELVAWLAVENQWREREAFINYFIKAMRIERVWIEGYSGPIFSKSDIFAALTADLPVIARAACKALGIAVE